MRVSIRDEGALKGVSPSALSAYARAVGWEKEEPYGDHSDIYVRRGAPEIVIPRTDRLGDYADVVSRLIEIFAEAADTDALSLYRELVNADCDVVRVRAVPERIDDAVTLEDGVHLINGARAMLLAAACSLWEPQPFYHGRPNRKASDCLQQVRLGQTEQGSYVITLLTPVSPIPKRPDIPFLGSDVESFGSILDDQPVQPVGRQLTGRLIEALTATHEAVERTIGGNTSAFPESVESGVSANLCDALSKMTAPFRGIDINLNWACTHPMETMREPVHFKMSDVSTLRRAAKRLRGQAPRPEVPLTGHIEGLKRDNGKVGGTITLRVSVKGKAQLISADLNQPDYDRAVRAHGRYARVVMAGDLEVSGRRWRLRNPRILRILGVMLAKSDDGGALLP